MSRHQNPKSTRPSRRVNFARSDKRAAILDAALKVFEVRGFTGARVDDIAEKAQVARQTIYSTFSGKDEIFRALAGSLADRLTGPLPDDQEPSDLRNTLIALAVRMRTILLQPPSLALYRLLISESLHFPEMTKEVYAIGPRKSVTMLAEYLRKRLPSIQTDEDALIAAEQFIGVVMGQSHLRALLGIHGVDPPAKINTERAVDRFLKGWDA